MRKKIDNTSEFIATDLRLIALATQKLAKKCADAENHNEDKTEEEEILAITIS